MKQKHAKRAATSTVTISPERGWSLPAFESDDARQLEAAHALRRSGKLQDAAKLYRDLVKRNSDNLVALHYLGVTEAGSGNFEKARRLLARSLAIQPPNLQFHENYATVLFQGGDHDAALEACESGLALSAGSIPLLYVSALALFKLGRPQESVAHFDRLLAVAPKHVVAHNERGSVLAIMKQYDAALASIEQAIALDPRCAEAHLNKAIVCGEIKRYEEALAAYDATLTLRPNIADAWLGRANLCCVLKRHDEALAGYDKALALNPRLAGAWLGRGNAFSALGRNDDALAAYASALALNPDLGEAWLGRGNILCETRRHDESLAAYDRALALNAEATGAWLGRGNVLFDLKRYDEARAAYDRALALDPDLADSWLGRGNLFASLKQYDEALAAYQRALTLNPGLAEASLGRGNVLCRTQHYDDSLAAYDRALELRPGFAEAWLGRGNALCETGRYDEALAAYEQALTLRPGLANAWLGRGNVFFDLRHYGESLAAHDHALALQPDLAEAMLGRGNVLARVRRYDDAMAAYDQALAPAPGLAKAWLGRGNVFNEQERHAEALAAYDRALALSPDLANAWLGLGQTLSKVHRHNEALGAHDRALALKPDLAEAWLSRSRALFETNRMAEALSSLDKALAIKPDSRHAISYRIYVLDFASDSVEEQQQARSLWWREVGAKIAAQAGIGHHANSRDPHRRLRIGYASADFRWHSAALCFRSVLRNHDKAAFEVTCYYSSLQEDHFTADFRQAAERWRNVTHSSGDEFCQQILDDQIDILVDLSAHTAGNRLGVFARKPAPIQVTAWGHATGTGMPVMDYLFSDPLLVPQEARHLFAEKMVDLPCFLTIEPLPDGVRHFDPPVLTKGYVTFGGFNRTTKITDEVVALWARILHAVPLSRIVLKHHGYEVPGVAQRMLEKFSALGIAPDRVTILGISDRLTHLAAFSEIDISLDPFPENGGISTFESVQMGIPVVALLGKAPASRAAGAILAAAGLRDWVAESTDDYLALAVKFASMPDHLTALRRTLPASFPQSEVGNGVKYTRAVEAAYRKMWIDYCARSA